MEPGHTRALGSRAVAPGHWLCLRVVVVVAVLVCSCSVFVGFEPTPDLGVVGGDDFRPPVFRTPPGWQHNTATAVQDLALSAAHFPLLVLVLTSSRPSDPDPTMRQLTLSSFVHALFPDYPAVVPAQRLLVAVAFDSSSFATQTEYDATLQGLDPFLRSAPPFVDVRVVSFRAEPNARTQHWIYKNAVRRCGTDPRCEYVVALEDDWLFVRETLPLLTMQRVLEAMGKSDSALNFVRWSKREIAPIRGDSPCVENDVVAVGNPSVRLPVTKTSAFSYNPHVVRADWLSGLVSEELFWGSESKLNRFTHEATWGRLEEERAFALVNGTCQHPGTGRRANWQGMYAWGSIGSPNSIVHLDGRQFHTHEFFSWQSPVFDQVYASAFARCCVRRDAREVVWPR